MLQDEKKLDHSPTKTSDKSIKELPLVSAVIPVYNVEEYLRECLDSVVFQTYHMLDIILIDDGSTDNSGKICDEYAERDTRVTVIHKLNGGLGNARNIGLDTAKGKYIVFLDSDDYWDLDTVAQLLKIAERDSLQLLVFSGEPFWDGVERPEDFPADYYCQLAQNNIIKTGAESLKTAWCNNEYFSSPGLRFYLREYLMNSGFRFDEGIIHEDISFSFLTYVFAERVECIGTQLYKRRFRQGSIMTTRTFRKTAQGYSVALTTLAGVYNRRYLTDLEKDVFIRQIRQLFYLIYNLYCEALAEENTRTKKYFSSDSRAISLLAREALKKAKFLSSYLTSKHRILIYSFEIGYTIQRLVSKIHLRRGLVIRNSNSTDFATKKPVSKK